MRKAERGRDRRDEEKKEERKREGEMKREKGREGERKMKKELAQRAGIYAARKADFGCPKKNPLTEQHIHCSPSSKTAHRAAHTLLTELKIAHRVAHTLLTE